MTINELILQNDILFCERLIGKPWKSGAIGPEAFDCWGLLCYIFKIRREIDLNPYPGITESGAAGSFKNAEKEAAGAWEAVASPQHFCAVAMGKGRRIEHVGLWVETGGGMILHCNEKSGTVCQSPASIRNTGIQNFTYYTRKP